MICGDFDEILGTLKCGSGKCGTVKIAGGGKYRSGNIGRESV